MNVPFQEECNTKVDVVSECDIGPQLGKKRQETMFFARTDTVHQHLHPLGGVIWDGNKDIRRTQEYMGVERVQVKRCSNLNL